MRAFYREDHAPSLKAPCTPSSTPIFAPELVLLFLEHLSPSEHVIASHVCQQWRELVYTRSEFTSSVILRSGKESAISQFTAQMNAPRTGPVDVFISIHACNTAVADRVLSILGTHLGRVFELGLEIAVSHADAMWNALRSSPPRLRLFHLDVLGPFPQPQSPTFPADIFGQHAPELRRLDITGVKMPAHLPPGLSNVSAVHIMQHERLEIYMADLIAYFPKLDALRFIRCRGGRVKLRQGPDPAGLTTAAPARLRELSLRMQDHAHAILRTSWPLALFRTVVVHRHLPTERVVADCLKLLPPGALHLVLRPSSCQWSENFLIELRHPGADRTVRFEEPRLRYEQGCDRLRALFERRGWEERVSDVTIALRIWSHPHLASWLPRLPNVKSIGIILDITANATPALSATLDCPALSRVDISTEHDVYRVDLERVQSMVNTGFKKKYTTLVLGVSVGVVVSGAVDRTLFSGSIPLPRSSRGYDLDSVW